MTVKEFALRQLHWMVQNDPWVQEIFLAGGESLDQLAERILAISRFDNFELLNRAQVEYYDKILGRRNHRQLHTRGHPTSVLRESRRPRGNRNPKRGPGTDGPGAFGA